MNQDGLKKKIKSNPMDQRYLPRWEVNNRVSLKVNNETKQREALSKDISCSGACIFIDELVKPKQKVVMKIALSKTVFAEVRGTIVWTRNEQNQILAGVMFENTPKETQELILHYAFELNREALIKHWFSGWSHN